MPERSEQPFRFLDHPLELRIMVYERLPIVTRHCRFQFPSGRPIGYTRHADDPSRPTSCVVILDITVPPVSILATCRRINSEAAPTLKLELLQLEPVRVIIDMTSIAPQNQKFAFALSTYSSSIDTMPIVQTTQLSQQRHSRHQYPQGFPGR